MTKPRWLAPSLFPVMAALALAGCGTPIDYGSDYLGSVAGLARVASDQESWRPAGANLARYNKIFIEPVELRFVGGTTSDPDDVARIRTYFRQAVMMAVSDGYTIVGGPEAGALSVRPALTGLVAGRNTDSGGDDMLHRSILPWRAKLEADIRDSISGRRIGAFVDHDTMPPDGSRRLTRWDRTRAVLDGWARRFRRQIDTLRAAPLAAP